jgi:hypothetical protein
MHGKIRNGKALNIQQHQKDKQAKVTALRHLAVHHQCNHNPVLTSFHQ